MLVKIHHVYELQLTQRPFKLKIHRVYGLQLTQRPFKLTV